MGALAEHLWQSTWFALAAASLALLSRKDAARFRYWIWFAASIKFLVPFSVLTWLGSRFVLQVEHETALLPIVQHVAAPLAGSVVLIDPLSSVTEQALVVIWTLGSLALLGRWCTNWLRARALVKSSLPCDIAAPISIRCCDDIDEPGVVGVRDPVLLMPTDLLAKLTTDQLDAIIAHESWHVRRRDNLVASLHAVIESLFWFHPLVWWIGAKLVIEREHACDECVIQDGREPMTYAEAILRACKHSMEARLMCVAQAGGGDLTARIRSIMSERRSSRLWAVQRAVVATALLVCVALPVAAGVKVIATSTLTVAVGARSIRVSEAPEPGFVTTGNDSIYARNVSLRELIGAAYAIDPHDVKGDQRWLDLPRYDIELRAPYDRPVDARALVAELLDQQFNLELIVRPTIRTRIAN